MGKLSDAQHLTKRKCGTTNLKLSHSLGELEPLVSFPWPAVEYFMYNIFSVNNSFHLLSTLSIDLTQKRQVHHEPDLWCKKKTHQSQVASHADVLKGFVTSPQVRNAW